MFNNNSIRRVLATLLAGLLIDAWILEAALAARGIPVAPAAPQIGGSLPVSNDLAIALTERTLLAQATPRKPKRTAPAQPPAVSPATSAPVPTVDHPATDRYTQTLQTISSVIAAEQSRGNI